jgi:hypothetical protein
VNIVQGVLPDSLLFFRLIQENKEEIMELQNFTANLSTKVDRDSDADVRELTFDMSQLSLEDLLEYAQRSIVIQAQSVWRSWMKSSKEKPSPWAGDVYKVPKPGTRTANPELSIAKAKKALTKLSPEQIRQLLESIAD